MMKSGTGKPKSGKARRILPEEKAVIDAVKKILKSGNEMVIKIMKLNIEACLSTVERKETILELQEEIERLKRSMEGERP